MNDADIKQHIFQTAGLGLAPYKFLGVTENLFTPPGGTARAGGSCDYCGTNIRYEFHLRSSDSHEFKVGSDCICQAGDKGLEIFVAGHKTKLRRAVALAKKQALIAQKIKLVDEIMAFLTLHHAAFREMPHPWGGHNYVTNAPRNWYEHAQFMVRHCGLPELLKFQAEVIQKKLDFDNTVIALARP